MFSFLYSYFYPPPQPKEEEKEKECISTFEISPNKEIITTVQPKAENKKRERKRRS